MFDLDWIDDFLPSVDGIRVKERKSKLPIKNPDSGPREHVKHLNDKSEGDLVRTPGEVAKRLSNDIDIDKAERAHHQGKRSGRSQ